MPCVQGTFLCVVLFNLGLLMHDSCVFKQPLPNETAPPLVSTLKQTCRKHHRHVWNNPTTPALYRSEHYEAHMVPVQPYGFHWAAPTSQFSETGFSLRMQHVFSMCWASMSKAPWGWEWGTGCCPYQKGAYSLVGSRTVIVLGGRLGRPWDWFRRGMESPLCKGTPTNSE